MDRCRAPAAKTADHGDAGDDPDELGVFAAERYFYGDDALWCERSSSSLSSAFRTGTLEHDRSVVPTPTAATSSSEASWNSRSALLPGDPPAEESRAGAGAAALAVEAEPSGAESERTGRRRASSSNLRRWLLGVAGCACARGGGEESVSADEMEAGDGVPGVGGEKCNVGAAKLPPKTEILREPAFESATAVTARPGSGRWLLEGDKVIAEREAFSPFEIAGHGHGHRRAANPRELSTAIFHPAAAATSDERRRIESPPTSALCSATQNSAFTIVAGNAPRAAGCGGGGSPGAEDDDAAPSELESAYPPSEASVVWSVITADGAASGNFSSAASGYYYHYFSYGEDGGTLRHAAAKSDRRRRTGLPTTATTTSSSLLSCMSEKAVDAVGPALSVHRPEVEPAAAARPGAAAGSRNGHGQDVIRRRVGR